ncbi:hypothetical protein BDZ89DRAFT_1124908 [Hymenopellis radicata]|nr:hypothetical protein BDZ89DRAFT_1124908 [Hymenopellis radicata]
MSSKGKTRAVHLRKPSGQPDGHYELVFNEFRLDQQGAEAVLHEFEACAALPQSEADKHVLEILSNPQLRMLETFFQTFTCARRWRLENNDKARNSPRSDHICKTFEDMAEFLKLLYFQSLVRDEFYLSEGPANAASPAPISPSSPPHPEVCQLGFAHAFHIQTTKLLPVRSPLELAFLRNNGFWKAKSNSIKYLIFSCLCTETPSSRIPENDIPIQTFSNLTHLSLAYIHVGTFGRSAMEELSLEVLKMSHFSWGHVNEIGSFINAFTSVDELIYCNPDESSPSEDLADPVSGRTVVSRLALWNCLGYEKVLASTVDIIGRASRPQRYSRQPIVVPDRPGRAMVLLKNMTESMAKRAYEEENTSKF